MTTPGEFSKPWDASQSGSASPPFQPWEVATPARKMRLWVRDHERGGYREVTLGDLQCFFAAQPRDVRASVLSQLFSAPDFPCGPPDDALGSPSRDAKGIGGYASLLIGRQPFISVYCAKGWMNRALEAERKFTWEALPLSARYPDGITFGATSWRVRTVPSSPEPVHVVPIAAFHTLRKHIDELEKRAPEERLSHWENYPLSESYGPYFQGPAGNGASYEVRTIHGYNVVSIEAARKWSEEARQFQRLYRVALGAAASEEQTMLRRCIEELGEAVGRKLSHGLLPLAWTEFLREVRLMRSRVMTLEERNRAVTTFHDYPLVYTFDAPPGNSCSEYEARSVNGYVAVNAQCARAWKDKAAREKARADTLEVLRAQDLELRKLLKDFRPFTWDEDPLGVTRRLLTEHSAASQALFAVVHAPDLAGAARIAAGELERLRAAHERQVFGSWSIADLPGPYVPQPVVPNSPRIVIEFNKCTAPHTLAAVSEALAGAAKAAAEWHTEKWYRCRLVDGTEQRARLRTDPTGPIWVDESGKCINGVTHFMEAGP